MTQKADALKQLDNLRSVENGDIHWGAAVMLSKECPRCGLRLSHPNHHITVFSCGKGVNYLVRMSNDVIESEYLKSCLLAILLHYNRVKIENNRTKRVNSGVTPHRNQIPSYS